MSTQQSKSESEQSQNDYSREAAVRATMQEINQAKDQFKTSDADRAPSYQLLPTGKGANRVLVAGTLTEVEDVGNEDEYLKATIVGQSGTVYAYAGQYSQDAANFLRNAETPMFVAMSGKMDFFADDDADIDERNVSLNPEWVTEISGDRRDEIIMQNALATIERADGDGVEALKERAESQYENDENFTDTDFRAGAVEVLEELDEHTTE